MTSKPTNFVVNLADLDKILQQIKIAEAHAAGADLANLVAHPLAPEGLRTVNGQYNSLLSGQQNFGAADQLMPRLLQPVWNAAQAATFDPDGPGPLAVGSQSSYVQTKGLVFDSQPRTISNLISDQTPNNPATVIAALAGVGSADPLGDAQLVAAALAAVEGAPAAAVAAQAAEVAASASAAASSTVAASAAANASTQQAAAALAAENFAAAQVLADAANLTQANALSALNALQQQSSANVADVAAAQAAYDSAVTDSANADALVVSTAATASASAQFAATASADAVLAQAQVVADRQPITSALTAQSDAAADQSSAAAAALIAATTEGTAFDALAVVNDLVSAAQAAEATAQDQAALDAASYNSAYATTVEPLLDAELLSLDDREAIDPVANPIDWEAADAAYQQAVLDRQGAESAIESLLMQKDVSEMVHFQSQLDVLSALNAQADGQSAYDQAALESDAADVALAVASDTLALANTALDNAQAAYQASPSAAANAANAASAAAAASAAQAAADAAALAAANMVITAASAQASEAGALATLNTLIAQAVDPALIVQAQANYDQTVLDAVGPNQAAANLLLIAQSSEDAAALATQVAAQAQTLAQVDAATLINATTASNDADAAILTTQAAFDLLTTSLGIPVNADGTIDIISQAPSFNGWMTLFGQFFDHGLDLVGKGGSGTVFIPLQPDDPLYVPGSPTNFMVLTRAANQPGADGVLGTTDDIREHRNSTTPFIDQNQTYTSNASHQAFLREYSMAGGNRCPRATCWTAPMAAWPIGVKSRDRRRACWAFG
jgi:Animal haem peroxidase